jgi:transposase
MQNLSPLERENLITQHKKERDKRVCDRIKAVLLFDEGWKYHQIAHVLLLSDEAVRQHILDFKAEHKLKPENGGSNSKLTCQQTDALLIHLRGHTYLYAKDIAAYVKTSFGVKYTVPGMTTWLHQHGFSYKKLAVVPGKANVEVQQQWIKEFEALKRTLSPAETICFIDGVHPTHNTKLAYGWIQKGERKEISTNTGRQRLNLSGAFDIMTKKVLIQEDLSLNAESTIAFLESLEAAYPEMRKIHVFCDNARYYKNKEVMAHLTHSKIEMHFLPPYSPNLNLIERLWKLLNERILYNKYYEKFSEFKKAVLGFLQSLSDPPLELAEQLAARLTGSFQIIGKKTLCPILIMRN